MLLKKAFANNKEELIDIIKRGMYWNTCILHPNGNVENGKGIISWCHWEKRRNRYCFYVDI